MLGSLRARRATHNNWDPADAPWLVGGLLAIGGVVVAVGLLLDYSAMDVWAGMIVCLVLIIASVPLFGWVVRQEGDPWLSKVLWGALAVKFVSSMVRYFMIEVVYGGSSDASRYHAAGVWFVNKFRDGDPIHPIPIMQGFPIETQRIGDLVGGLYTVTGPSQHAAFFVFAYGCLWGQILMVRAFKVAVPEGDYRRYALLVLFLPSIVYWPSSVGKEALMVLLLGVISYGGALLLAPKPRIKGVLFFVAGSLAVLLVRPHVAVMSIAGLLLAFVIAVLVGTRGEPGQGPTDRPGRGRWVRVVGLVVLVALAGVGSSRLGEFFGDDDEGGGTQAVLDDAARQSAGGESEFTPVGVSGPSQVPAGFVSVYFRPFPWEANNVNALLAAAESLLLLGLFVVGWRRSVSFPKLARQRPYLVFASVYMLLFAIGFSYIANFGILARQRVQALPFLLVLLALPRFQGALVGAARVSEGGNVDVAGSVETLASKPEELQVGR